MLILFLISAFSWLAIAAFAIGSPKSNVGKLPAVYAPEPIAASAAAKFFNNAENLELAFTLTLISFAIGAELKFPLAKS